MRRNTKLRAVTVFLLLVILLGSLAAVSIVVTEVLLVVVLVVALIFVIITFVGPHLRKGKRVLAGASRVVYGLIL